MLWTVDIYAFLLAGSLITMGAWGDRIGHRRLLVAGAAGYGAASVLAAYSVTPEMLIGARALMGVAGATLMPATLALVSALFPEPRRRTTAISVIVASVSGGTALGPLVGGWLLGRFWWGSAFLLAVPVMGLLLALVPALLPEHRSPTARRLDLTSALLSLAAVLPVVYGLKQAAAGESWPVPAGTGAAGLAVAVVFARRQLRAAEPFIDIRLFRERPLAVAAATLTLGIFVLWGSNYAIAQYLQLVAGLLPQEAGLWTAPSALGVIAGSALAPRLVRWFSPARVIAAGLLLSVAGYGILGQVGAGTSLGLLVTGAVVVSAGLGPMMALATDLVIGSAPPAQAGAAAAISTTAPQLGGAVGIATLGSVITLGYRAEIAGAVPAGLPEPVASAARDSLHAVAAADLAGPDGDSLLAAAQQAFASGFQVAATVSGGLMAATAGLVLVWSRRPRR